MQPRHTLHKKQRLKSRKAIDGLFREGKSFALFPFRILYLVKKEADEILKTGFSAPTKNFKKAVHRNRIKRLIKESYRLNRQELVDTLQKMDVKMDLFLIYTGKELPDQVLVNSKITVILQQLIKRLNESIS